ncbi:MAG: SDR family oxidoreductase [Methanobacteriota archaeon]
MKAPPPPAARFHGKFALVTGASGGMGAEACRRLAREGAAGIAIHYARRRERAEALAAEIREAGTRAIVIAADVSRRDEAHRLVATALSEFGRIDVGLLFASHPFRREEWFGTLDEIDEARLTAPMRTDAFGSLFAAQALLPAMRREKTGSLVLVSSTPAFTGDVAGITYLAAKAATAALAKSLAHVAARDGVRVNAVAPGSILTDAMTTETTPGEAAALADEPVLKRWGKVEEVVEPILFLASDDASYVTGEVLVVDGGYYLR